MLSEQLDDVDESHADSSETYDVEQMMAVATINEASATTIHLIGVLRAAADGRVLINKKVQLQRLLTS